MDATLASVEAASLFSRSSSLLAFFCWYLAFSYDNYCSSAFPDTARMLWCCLSLMWSSQLTLRIELLLFRLVSRPPSVSPSCSTSAVPVMDNSKGKKQTAHVCILLVPLSGGFCFSSPLPLSAYFSRSLSLRCGIVRMCFVLGVGCSSAMLIQNCVLN